MRLPLGPLMSGVVVFALLKYFTEIATLSMSLYGSPGAIISASEEFAEQARYDLAGGESRILV